jgi:hypothetical protein
MREYYAELPFLHKPSLVTHARESTKVPCPQSNTLSTGVLIAFHALTSHHELSESGQRFVASDLYAEAALSQIDRTQGLAALEIVQTLLMVGDYYWDVVRRDSGRQLLKRGLAQDFLELLHTGLLYMLDGTSFSAI